MLVTYRKWYKKLQMCQFKIIMDLTPLVVLDSTFNLFWHSRVASHLDGKSPKKIERKRSFPPLVKRWEPTHINYINILDTLHDGAVWWVGWSRVWGKRSARHAPHGGVRLRQCIGSSTVIGKFPNTVTATRRGLSLVSMGREYLRRIVESGKCALVSVGKPGRKEIPCSHVRKEIQQTQKVCKVMYLNAPITTPTTPFVDQSSSLPSPG